METTYQMSEHLQFIKVSDFYYLYHDLFGFVLQMSEDILDFIKFFKEKQTKEQAMIQFRTVFGEDNVAQFLNVFNEYYCLLTDKDSETNRIWKMFPIRAKWYVYRRNDQGMIVLYSSNKKDVEIKVFNEWQTYFWDHTDGNSQISAMFAEIIAKFKKEQAEFKSEFLNFVSYLTSLDRQALKLSDMPIELYKKDPSTKPPYLLSFIPRYVEDNEWAALEYAKRSFYYLLQKPHVAIGNKSYGKALIESFKNLDSLPENVQSILDLSVDCGFALKNIITQFEQLEKIDVVIPDKKYIELYNKNIGEKAKKINFIIAPDLISFSPDKQYDLILMQEKLGSLPHITVDKENPPKEFHKIAEKYNLFYNDAPNEFLFNLGAVKLLEKLSKHISDTGLIIITEYGEEFQYPSKASTSTRQQVFLVHFAFIKNISRTLGFDSMFTFIMDFLNLNRNLFILSTNSQHFHALQKLAEDMGKKLEYVPQTPEMIKKMFGKTEVGNLFFERIEDRCMSIVPHQLKILALSKTAFQKRPKFSS